MDRPWSADNIDHDTSYTSRSEMDRLERAIDGSKKRTFHQIDKSGSSLEVYGENPRILVNQLSSDSAAIWYCLYDGTLLNSLKDESQKAQISELLQKYFNPPILPVIPIIRTAQEHEPKYRFQGEKTRIYSLHGGANLRTFLHWGYDDQYKKEYFPQLFIRICERLEEKGFAFSNQSVGNQSPLSNCAYYLETQRALREQLTKMDADAESIELVIRLELYSKLFTTQEVLELLGVEHGHPHGGNWVVSWSKEPLTQTELERELIKPEKIKIDSRELQKEYPDCFLHPFLIDFDMTRFRPSSIENSYDEQKIIGYFEDPNKMHRALAMQLLPIEHWPQSFLLSLFTTNQDLTEQVSRKLKHLRYYSKATPQMLSAFFIPLMENGIDAHSPTMRHFLESLTPGLFPEERNRSGWKHWITFFQDHSNFHKLKKEFFATAYKESESTQTKKEFIVLVDELIRENKKVPLRFLRRVFDSQKGSFMHTFGEFV